MTWHNSKTFSLLKHDKNWLNCHASWNRQFEHFHSFVIISRHWIIFLYNKKNVFELDRLFDHKIVGFQFFIYSFISLAHVHTVCTVHCTLYPNTQLLTLMVRYCQISVARWSFTISLPFSFIVDAKLLLCVANGIVTIDVLINRPMDLFLNW